MASTSKITLASGALTASSTSLASALPSSKNYIGWLNVSANNGSTTVNAKIQHSPDGTNWIDFCTFAAVVNTTGVQAIHPASFAVANQSLFPNIRSVITLTGASATVEVSLWFDADKG
jgi:hypothetical protein